MKLDVHSKHGVLVGWLHLIAYIIFAIDPSLRAIKYDDEYDELTEMRYVYILQALGFLFMATLSGLLIYGVIQKRHLFMAPWLVCATMVTIYIAGALVIQCFTMFEQMLFFLDNYFYMIGMQILVIYPTYNLYSSIREYSKKVVYSKNIEYANTISKSLCDSFENPMTKENNDILSEKLQV